MFRATRLLLLSCLLLGLATAPAFAQTGLATVTGLVTDNSGAAVPGVTVTATNQATNVDYTGVSNEAGAYVITAVPIGAYVVRSELTGFKTVVSNVTLSAAQSGWPGGCDKRDIIGRARHVIHVAARGCYSWTSLGKC